MMRSYTCHPDHLTQLDLYICGYVSAMHVSSFYSPHCIFLLTDNDDNDDDVQIYLRLARLVLTQVDVRFFPLHIVSVVRILDINA